MTTTSAQHRLQRRRACPRTSLSPHHADHADSRRKRELLVERVGQRAARPCGLCAASTHDASARVRTRSSRPGERHRRERPRGRPRRRAAAVGAGAEERLDRGQRQRRVLRLVRAVQRQEDLVVRAAEALQRQQLPADRDVAAQHAELACPRGRPCASTSAHRSSSTSATSGGCCGEHRDRARLDDAGLLPRDVRERRRRGTRCGRARSGVITATRPSATLVASQRAAQADLDAPPTSTGASANAANAIAGEHLEVATAGTSAPRVDHRHVRLDVAVRLDEALRR